VSASAAIGTIAAAPEPQHYPLPPGLLFFCVIATPPLIFYLGLSSSNSLGMCLIAALLLLMPQPKLNTTLEMPGVRPVQCQRVVLFVLAAIAAHLVLASLFGPLDPLRAVASFVLVALLLFAGGVVANALISSPPAAVHQGMMLSFFALCAIALVGTTGWGPPTLAPGWRSPVFPFSEPSAFAMPFIPVLMYVSVANRGIKRLAFIAFGLACAGLIQNLTLAVGCMLVAAVSFRVVTLAVLSLPLVYFLAQLDLTYFIERLDFSGDGQNLSNLLYVLGWQMFAEAMELSSGIGVGFQQLGMHGTEAPVAEILSQLYDGENLDVVSKNALGSLFVFAKLGGEFGVFGILLALAFIFLVVRSALALRRVALGKMADPPLVILARCVVVSYMIEMFVRGVGYFTGTGIMMVASLWILWHWRRAAVR
jgi:hypothetical protein